MNLQLNLATRYYVDFRKVNLSIAFIFSIVFFWFIADTYLLVTNYEEFQRLSGYKTSMITTGPGEKISDADYNRTLTSIKFTNTILEKRSYDWLTLLDNMESVVPNGVSLTGLVPDEKSSSIKLTGAARSIAAVRTLIEGMQSSQKFSEVFLTDHAILKGNDSVKGITFSVTCKALK